MKKLVKVLTFIMFMFLSGNLCIAQEYIMGIGDYINYANINKANAETHNSYDAFRGSPFLYSNFKKGTLKLENGKMYEGPLRYDIYADQMEFRSSDGDIFAVKNPETIQHIVIGDIQMKYFSTEKGNSLDGYYELLVEGNFLLFEKHIVELKDPVAAKPYVEPKPASFSTKKSKFLIMNSEGNFTEVSNKKDLTGLNMEKSVQIEKFIKANKIKISDKEDMIEFVNYLNK